ncbi:hypothetical protein [Nocardioides ungokensis]|uniref:hypothetical protein n=1 Tax=Nocardioides ungokensis TaxID=1643322 RepID=UPI0015DF6C8F|nr:hypothetical protein [Nocardioides ungokensis]
MRNATALGAAIVSLAALVAGCSSSPSTSSAPGPGTSTSRPASPHADRSPSRSATPSAPHATEFNPPGDIPDNAVFVDHTAPGSRVHYSVPEGWARSSSRGVTTFTDKYNSISIEVRKRAGAPTVASARSQDVPALKRSVPSFSGGAVTMVSRKHGSAVHITYQLDSAPNPVTDKVVRDVAERFEFWHSGQEAILTLTGPVNADNVDPWQIVSDSLQWR